MLAGTAVEREPSDPSYGIYAYTGREWDPETNLYYYRARYYDPKIGRFISEDPIEFESGVNFYAYVANNPANHSDPRGLQAGAMMVGMPASVHIPGCAERAFNEEFDAAMARGNRGWKFTHCMAACRVMRECKYPPFVVKAMGAAYEGYQTITCWLGNKAACDSANAPEDYKVNEVGYSCPRDVPCSVRCKDYWLQDKSPNEHGPYSRKR